MKKTLKPNLLDSLLGFITQQQISPSNLNTTRPKHNTLVKSMIHLT